MSILGAASLLTSAAGFGLSAKKSKFRAPQLPSLSDLAGQAVEAQKVQLQGGIGNLQRGRNYFEY